MDALPRVLKNRREALLKDWMKEQQAAGTLRPDLLAEAEMRAQSQELLELLAQAAAKLDLDNFAAPAWEPLKEFLVQVSRGRATKGYSPVETATFVFSLKQPLFSQLRAALGDSPALAEAIWQANAVLDRLGLFTMEVFQRSREEVIKRQQQELLELSTPVIELWEGVLALPLIGTLDSSRTQVVMEALLQRIADTGSTIAIIDITGVPMVDTLVAQHLLKTVAAARLMGAECIISGIRPAIAQTIVHLGVQLADVMTKATLADALAVAFDRLRITVQRDQKG